MILAGGMSTRLYPLTLELPKPLVPIAGEPNCLHVMRYLQSFGIKDIAINVYYHADQVKDRLGDGSECGVRLHYLNEAKLMGSAGAVKQMEGFFDGTFVVIGCDDLTDLNLEAVIAFHRKRRALATIALVRADDVSQYGVVILDENGKIVDFQEKPEPGTERSHLLNTGIYVFEPAILDWIEAGAFVDFGKNVFPALQAAGAPFYGIEMPGAYWCDIGTPSEYRRASNDVVSGHVRLLGASRPRGIPRDFVLGDDVVIDGDVRLGAGVRLGRRVHIAGPSVVGDGSSIGDDATVVRSIIWDNVSIGPRARLVDTIVGNSYAVAPDATLNDQIVANEPAEAAS